MKEGIEESENFLLFLSEGVASRPYVQLEVRHAIALHKRIILVHEVDPRHGTSLLLLEIYERSFCHSCR
jgi:hypothetical protein